MARVLISREMRLQSFDAATQSIRTYLWLYPVFFHAVSFVNYAYAYVTDSAFRRAFGVRTSRFYTKKNSSRRKTARARVSFTGVRGDYAPSLHQILLFSPTRWRPSLRVLSPRSRPASGLTLLLLAHTHLDDSIGISSYRSNMKQQNHERYKLHILARMLCKKDFSLYKNFAEEERTSANNVAIFQMPVRCVRVL